MLATALASMVLPVPALGVTAVNDALPRTQRAGTLTWRAKQQDALPWLANASEKLRHEEWQRHGFVEQPLGVIQSRDVVEANGQVLR